MIDFSNNWIDSSIPSISISQVLDLCETPFDSEKVAQLTYNKHFDNPDSQYYHKTVQEIMEMWSNKGAESCHYGSLLDDYIGFKLTNENYELVDEWMTKNKFKDDQRLQGLCKSFNDFYNVMMKSGNIKFVAREQTLYLKVKNPYHSQDPSKYSEFIYIKGRFDALFYNQALNKYIVIDWKSSGTIDKLPNNWTKKMLGPANSLYQLNWYRYTNQVYFYKKALLDSNYIQSNVKADDIICMIVHLPGHMIESCNSNFEIHQGAYPYDPILLNNILEWGAGERLKEQIEKQEYEQSIINESNQKQQEDLINTMF